MTAMLMITMSVAWRENPGLEMTSANVWFSLLLAAEKHKATFLAPIGIG